MKKKEIGGWNVDALMERALELARRNVKDGGDPFGAVLAKDGEIIAEGVNELHKTYDISAHAELIAIRNAQAKLQTHDLTGYTMYASGQPCPMCLSAMYFTNIKDVYYCLSVNDAEKVGLGRSKQIYENLQKPFTEREIVLKQIPLQQEAENPFQMWEECHEVR